MGFVDSNEFISPFPVILYLIAIAGFISSDLWFVVGIIWHF
jgi:hypothetical protein